MKQHRMPDLHDLQVAPILEPVSGRRPSILRPGDQRPACDAAAAAFWRDATLAAGMVEVGEHLGVSDVSVGRWARGERPLTLGTVLAAPPRVAAVVLRRALDRVEGQVVRPISVREAIGIVAGAIELAERLAASPVETMSEAVKRELAELAERTGLRLFEIARALRGGR